MSVNNLLDYYANVLSLTVCCVCVCVRHPNLTYRPTNDTIYLTGNEGQKICGNFSEIAAFVSYGVKQKLKSRLQMSAGTRPLLFVLEVCQKLHVG